MLSHEVGERMAAAVAAPALACLMTGLARAFLDHVFGAAARAAGDRRVDGREDNHGEGVRDKCFTRRVSQADRQGAAPGEDKKTPCHQDTAHRERDGYCPPACSRLCCCELLVGNHIHHHRKGQEPQKCRL